MFGNTVDPASCANESKTVTSFQRTSSNDPESTGLRSHAAVIKLVPRRTWPAIN
jgi:hypothetical protein